MTKINSNNSDLIFSHHFLDGSRAFGAESQSLSTRADPVLPLRPGSF